MRADPKHRKAAKVLVSSGYARDWSRPYCSFVSDFPSTRATNVAGIRQLVSLSSLRPDARGVFVDDQRSFAAFVNEVCGLQSDNERHKTFAQFAYSIHLEHVGA